MGCGMIKTNKELTDDERNKLSDWGFETRKPKDKLSDKYGLCSSCISFFLIETELDTRVAKCTEQQSKISLSTLNPVRRCTLYHSVNDMNMQQMISMAYIIELDVEKKVGF